MLQTTVVQPRHHHVTRTMVHGSTMVSLSVFLQFLWQKKQEK